jgi:hypothetical protein
VPPLAATDLLPHLLLLPLLLLPLLLSHLLLLLLPLLLLPLLPQQPEPRWLPGLQRAGR